MAEVAAPSRQAAFRGSHLLAYCSENFRMTSRFLDSVATSVGARVISAKEQIMIYGKLPGELCRATCGLLTTATTIVVAK